MYIADAETVVGVPEISPVLESNVNPAGKDGDTSQVITAPPLLDGVAADIVVPLVNVNEVVE